MPTLDWRNRRDALRAAAAAPLRALTEVPALSVGTPDEPNLLVHGENLDALKALLPFAAGRVKCICIDPPYNTGSAFANYDDHLEHSTWLSLLYPRLELLRQFLSEDGSIWISIDDDEQAYLKVICDEIFGRQNFVATVVWQKRTSPDNRLRLGDAHDYILVYQKCKDKWLFNQIEVSEGRKKDFKNPDNDPRGPWASVDITGMKGHATPNQFYTIVSPAGVVFPPPEGRCWALAKSTFEKLYAENRIWFGKKGKSRPRQKRFLSDLTGQNCWTWWTKEEVGHNQEAKKEINVLFGANNPFDTPKPERLIRRILEIATDEGDLVLDSFLGSGTTAAVAHKMKRRWIGVEMGDHARTHCAVRMKKVVEGEQGGISKAVKWEGGGGFHFLELGEVLRDGTGAVRTEISWDVLAAHLWWTETKTGYWTARPSAPPSFLFRDGPATSPVLGIHDGTAYALLFNGILKDRRVNGGNVLTRATLDLVQRDLTRLHPGETPQKLVVFAEWSRLGQAALEAAKIEFRPTVASLEDSLGDAASSRVPPAASSSPNPLAFQESAPCN